MPASASRLHPRPLNLCFNALQGLSSLQALHVGFNRIAEAVDLDRLQSESIGTP